MSDVLFFDSFAKGKQHKQVTRSKECVIYTRVSGKDQVDNLSLGTQLKACTSYAEKFGFDIMAQFGGTYESAENDERKQFTAMLSFVKKYKGKISAILVYSLERFSRNDNSIWLSGELRRLGIEIISVTQPIDTSNASGQMQQKLLFLFGEFDNQLRKQKCTAGIREMLLRGDWPTSPPLGFDIDKSGNRRKIVVNAKGRLLRQAFEWKAYENVSNEVIRDRLALRGLKLIHQRISEIFRNPFYCGLMVHNMLEGKVVEGNHEKLVPRELFLKVNGLLDTLSHGFSINEENVDIPLKRFMVCAECGRPLSGYLARKKNIHYYKCKTKACCNNKNANDLNRRFERVLEFFKIETAKDYLELIKNQVVATFNQLTKHKETDLIQLENSYREIKSKVDRLEERYIEEEVSNELYTKYHEKYSQEKYEIERNLMTLSNKSSNLVKCVELAIEYATQLPSKWVSGDYHTKQQLQSLLFPKGISYDKKNDKVRTKEINFVFLYIAYFQQVVLKKQRGIPELDLNYASFAASVAGSRIELPTSGL
ncbi:MULTISPECIES: recombinase family protein [Pedobacter]|uniref:Site-specific DNA recombinase n=1 Tax=Pedobacter suwonensis TaxID=332999 RepID=A0A1I0TT63_9SPHI|nr:recombinase family protein [Pedobacter suwonensis]SFA54922.1 Site-specific DNA recombinase [Pedobacter suwonensis]